MMGSYAWLKSEEGLSAMAIRHALGTIRWRTISAISRREFALPAAGPTVSFTFDDFPRSALTVGGAILKSCGACGTYYAALGLMNKINDLGQQFCTEDLQTLLRAGHELGSHTLSHISCRSVSLPDFLADARKGKQAVEQITGIRDAHHFSYPYGHATLRAKQRIGASVSSCRGIVPGINESPVDLNLLRANRLYSWSFDLDSIDQLLKANERCRGWLIFYTHDISETPSPFGCKPGEFESAVKLAVTRRARIVPVGKAISSGQ
jgi:peptidoglycan/xylan/chitin deacetylase (PgdA/CDA1 family)